jgi:hypothetical protein
VLLVIGALLLADNLNLFGGLAVSVWQIIWPLALIALGIWVLWGTTQRGKHKGEEERRIVPVQDSSRAKIELDYGAGEVSVKHGAEPGTILSGKFEGGVETHVNRQSNTASIRLSNPAGFFWGPWNWGPSFRRRWSVHLSDQLPLELTVETGASDCRLDLTELRVERLHLDTGASSTRLQLPRRAGHTKVTGSSGAASVSIRVPEGVAARIRASGGIASISVDRNRFPRQGSIYVSPDYETAENTVDIEFDMGVGSLEIS